MPPTTTKTKTSAPPPSAPASPPEEHVDPTTGEVLPAAFSTSGNTALTAGDADDYSADLGAGFDNQTSEDVSIPFLSILQPGSPEVQGEEAIGKAGMIINKTTLDVASGRDGVSFVPALTQHLLVEWVPRDKGGGLVAQHAIDSELAQRVRATQPLGSYKHPENGNDLVETFYIYGVALDNNGTGYPAVISFSSTHIKAYKDWMFRARSIVVALPDGRKITNMPLFSHAYTIRTERVEKNGNTWYVPRVTFAGKNAEESRLPANSDIYQAAKGVRQAIASGAARAATETLTGETRVDATPQRGSTDQEKAPY